MKVTAYSLPSVVLRLGDPTASSPLSFRFSRSASSRSSLSEVMACSPNLEAAGSNAAGITNTPRLYPGLRVRTTLDLTDGLIVDLVTPPHTLSLRCVGLLLDEAWIASPSR